MSRRIHVVINPASGQPQPILNTLNGVFHPLGIDITVVPGLVRILAPA